MQHIDCTAKFLVEEKGNRNILDSVCQLHMCHLLEDDLELGNLRKAVSMQSRSENFAAQIGFGLPVGTIHVIIQYKYLAVQCELMCRGTSLQLILGINVINVYMLTCFFSINKTASVKASYL